MKNFSFTILLVLLSACTSYSYPVQDAGDGVYYAASPPNITYVNGYSNFNYYYSPYFYPYYFSVWHSPLIDQHYYGWHTPYYPYRTAWVAQDLHLSALDARSTAPGLDQIYKGTMPAIRPLEPIDLRSVRRGDVALRPSGANRSQRSSEFSRASAALRAPPSTSLYSPRTSRSTSPARLRAPDTRGSTRQRGVRSLSDPPVRHQ